MLKLARVAIPALVAASVVLCGVGLITKDTRAEEAISFAGDVFPILELRCLECHQPGGDGYKESGLDVSTYEALMKGTKHGPIIVPGSALTSNFIVLVEGRAAPEIQMPHGRKKLTKCEKGMLRRWVNTGAEDN